MINTNQSLEPEPQMMDLGLLYNSKFMPQFIFDNWRPIPNLEIQTGENIITNVQKYYEFATDDFLLSSAPNTVSLYFNTVLDNQNYHLDYIDGKAYLKEVVEKYVPSK